MSITLDQPSAGGAEPNDRPAVDLTKHDDQAAPEATGLDRLKEQAREAFAEDGPVRTHLGRAWTNTGSWLATADVTDGQLAAEVLRQRQTTHKQQETELRRQLAQIATQIIAAKRIEVADVRTNDPRQDGDAVAILKGRKELIEAQLRAHREIAEELAVEPTAAEVGRARWGRRAGRAAALVAGVVGGGIYLPMQSPSWLMVSLPAAAVALWRVGVRADDSEQAEPVAVHAEQGTAAEGPAFAAAVLAARQAAEAATTPGAAAAQQVAAAAEQAAQIQGAGDLISALVRAGIISKAEQEETRIVGVIRPDGPGWTATVELPGGIPAEDAIGKAAGLASALKVKSSQLQMSKDTSEEGHEGRFVIWCANVANPYAGVPVPSELIGAATWDFWKQGVPLGTNARGVRRILNMLWNSLLIGGLMGYGKSYLARLVVAAAVLDPYVDIVLLCGKAGADWAALKIVARHYVVGNAPATIREMHEVMEDVIAEMAAHGQALEKLFETDPATCPEGKITPQLARRPDLHLTVLVVDELQEILDAAAGMKLVSADEAEAAETSERKAAGQNGKTVMVSLFARFMRVARFVGGMAVIVTQRPDSNSVPTELREVASKRACFRVKGQNSSRMVLGDDAVAAGAAPHLLLDPHKGVSVIDEGGEEGHDTVKADVINLDEFRAICERGRALRVKAGTLTGQAAERWEKERADVERRQLLGDAIAAMDSQNTDRARLVDLASWMAALAPDRWSDLTETTLGARLREYGAGTTTRIGAVGDTAKASGYTRDQIAGALGRASA